MSLLVFIGVGLFSALALRFEGRWRIPFWLFAIALPVALPWSDFPTGQLSELFYVVVVGALVIAAIIGAVLGKLLQLAHIVPLTSIAVIFVAGGTFAGFVLWRQYVPSICRETPLQVQIAGKTLHIPAELQPRLENGSDIFRFGRDDRKYDDAQLCRMSRNGERVIEMETVWISPVSNHETMTAACKGTKSPAWCDNYSPDPYRHIDKLLIAPESEPGFPLPYWGKGSIRTERQGDLTNGSVCLLSDADAPERLTQCWIWRPFGDGFRMTVNTFNQDQIFNDMPAEEAREMIRRVRDMTLGIIGQ